MPAITIPQKKSKDVVTIPRQDYEEFLEWQRKIKSVKTYKMTPQEKKELALARRDFARGNYITLEELKRELGFTNR